VAGSLNKSSCLVPYLGVIKFIIVIDMILVTLFVKLKSDLDVQQTHLVKPPSGKLTEGE
jgi:hypothetical protein